MMSEFAPEVAKYSKSSPKPENILMLTKVAYWQCRVYSNGVKSNSAK